MTIIHRAYWTERWCFVETKDIKGVGGQIVGEEIILSCPDLEDLFDGPIELADITEGS